MGVREGLMDSSEEEEEQEEEEEEEDSIPHIPHNMSTAHVRPPLTRSLTHSLLTTGIPIRGST